MSNKTVGGNAHIGIPCMRSGILTAIAALAVLLVSPAALAETYYFVGGSNPPTFATASNWATAEAV